MTGNNINLINVSSGEIEMIDKTTQNTYNRLAGI